MDYKVTIEKCEKILGEPLLGLMHPWKSWRLRLSFGLILVAILIIIIFIPIIKNRIGTLTVLSKDYFFGSLFFSFAIFVLGGIILSIIMTPYLFKEIFRKEVAQKMKELVNDLELLWLNFEYEKKQNKSIEFRWEKSGKNGISNTEIKALSFLKKEGTSQGVYRKIPTWKNSNTATHSFKRMAKKGLVESTGNDYKYIPWSFVIVNDDDARKELHHEEAEKLKHLLTEMWEKMIDENDLDGGI